MESVFRFLHNYFNFKVLLLFLISSYFLLHLDCKYYKSKGLSKERKFSMYVGLIYIAAGLLLYGLSRFIRI